MSKIAENCDSRLGEFSPIGRLFALGRFLIKSIPNFGLLFSTVQVEYSPGQKMGWASFLAIFSQTHLVALTASCHYQ
jgi:hypothetical protein